MIIGVPLLIGLPKIGVPVGPMIYQEESDEGPEPEEIAKLDDLPPD